MGPIFLSQVKLMGWFKEDSVVQSLDCRSITGGHKTKERQKTQDEEDVG